MLNRSLIEPLLTPHEVAEVLRISVRTLNRVVATGELPFINIPGGLRRTMRFRASDVQGFIDRSCMVPAQPLQRKRAVKQSPPEWHSGGGFTELRRLRLEEKEIQREQKRQRQRTQPKGP